MSFNNSGAIGGLQLGYNWQIERNWVVGIEADFDWSGINGSSSSNFLVGAAPTPVTAIVNEKVDWFGTVRARLGFIQVNSLLTYLTGGLAYGRVVHSGSYNTGAAIGANTGGFSYNCVAGGVCFSGSSGYLAGGWTAARDLNMLSGKMLHLKPNIFM